MSVADQRFTRLTRLLFSLSRITPWKDEHRLTRLIFFSFSVGDEDGKTKTALLKMRVQFMLQVPQDDIKSLRQVSSFSSEASDDAHPISEEPVKWRRSKVFELWDLMTAKLAGAANLPFLLLHLPQIVLNTRNLLERNTSALLAVPWLGVLTGLLENLCLASYFIKKRKTEATVVQTLGVISTYVVMLQLAMVKAMPLPQFIVTSVVVAPGLIINFT
ncbi:hypothetical protein ACS0TY_008299 [Phlomoides rotata]